MDSPDFLAESWLRDDTTGCLSSSEIIIVTGSRHPSQKLREFTSFVRNLLLDNSILLIWNTGSLDESVKIRTSLEKIIIYLQSCELLRVKVKIWLAIGTNFTTNPTIIALHVWRVSTLNTKL